MASRGDLFRLWASDIIPATGVECTRCERADRATLGNYISGKANLAGNYPLATRILYKSSGRNTDICAGALESSSFIYRLGKLSERNIVGVIQGFFDESGREGDCPYAVYAGAVADAKAWEAMSLEWQSALDDKGISALHMVDAMNFENAFRTWQSRRTERDELLARLAIIFNNHIEHRICNPHDVPTFLSLPEKQRKSFKRLHYVLFEGCIKGLLTIADLKPNDVLHLFFDSSEEHSVDCLRLYLKMRKQDQLLRSKCALLAFGEDELLPPLQAVDMFAYCEYQFLANDGKPRPMVALLRSMLHGEQGMHLNMEYDIKNEDADLGSSEIRIVTDKKEETRS